MLVETGCFHQKKQTETTEHKLIIFLRGGPAFCCGYNSQTWRFRKFWKTIWPLWKCSPFVPIFVSVLEDRNGWCFWLPLLLFLLFLPPHVHELNELRWCPLQFSQGNAACAFSYHASYREWQRGACDRRCFDHSELLLEPQEQLVHFLSASLPQLSSKQHWFKHPLGYEKWNYIKLCENG